MPAQIIKSYEMPATFGAVHAKVGRNVRAMVTGTVNCGPASFPGGTPPFWGRSCVAHPLKSATARSAALRPGNSLKMSLTLSSILSQKNLLPTHFLSEICPIFFSLDAPAFPECVCLQALLLQVRSTQETDSAACAASFEGCRNT
jgi:hypothetical protein